MIGAAQVRLRNPIDGPAGMISVVTVSLPGPNEQVPSLPGVDRHNAILAACTGLPPFAVARLAHCDATEIADAAAGLLSAHRQRLRDRDGMKVGKWFQNRRVLLEHPFDGLTAVSVRLGAPSVALATKLNPGRIAALSHADREAIHQAMCQGPGEAFAMIERADA